MQGTPQPLERFSRRSRFEALVSKYEAAAEVVRNHADTVGRCRLAATSWAWPSGLDPGGRTRHVKGPPCRLTGKGLRAP